MSSVALDFAIIGAQKSASTYVHRLLLGHRQVDIPSVESRNFEDPWYSAGGVASLPGLFGPRRAGVRRGLKRPDHLADPAVPARLVDAAPEVRVVAVLRDPVLRAIAAYVHYVRLGFLPLLPLDAAFEQILDGRLGARYARADDVIDYGCYGRHLERWLRHLPGERMLVLSHQDLARDPVALTVDLLQFLDVDPAPASELVATTPRANTSTYLPARLRLQGFSARRRFAFTPDRYRRTPRTPGALGFAAAGLATLVDRRVLARADHATIPTLRPDLARQLRDVYAEDESLLVELFGRHFWTPAV